MRLFFIFWLFLIPAAFAEEDAQLIAFSEGRYTDAIALAQTEISADALGFSARSFLAEAMSVSDFDPPLENIKSAEALARKALEIDPTHIEGRLQLAIALSLRARPLTNREALRAGHGDEAKALVDSVLTDDPQNLYANGFLAVWHIEVRRRGGAIGASFMGASVKKGRDHYAAAIAVDAGDASTHWQYARALCALNAKKYRAEIEQALKAAIASPIETELERIMQSRAQALYDVLKSKPRQSAEAHARQML